MKTLLSNVKQSPDSGGTRRRARFAAAMPGSGGVMALRERWNRQLVRYRYYRQIYLLVLLGFVYFLVFKIAPLWGLVVAFVDYSPYKGLFGSRWVWFDNFSNFGC